MQTKNDPVADFLAKGGTIRKVEAGAATMSPRDWHNAERGITRPSAVAHDDEFAYEREAEVFASARYNGLSVDGAMQEVNDYRIARSKWRK